MKKKTSFFKNTLKAALVLFISVLSLSNQAQNVTVSGALVGNGTYPDLNSAFTAINSGAQTAANITVAILANTNETASAILNAGAWNSVSVTPTSGNYTVSGNIVGPLVDLNGADNVTFNGINASGNYLTFDNTNTGNVSTSTIRFINDASFNTLTNCRFSGASTLGALGTVVFSTAVTAGNSNNTISSCEIGESTAGSAVNGIFSIGTLGFENANNSIVNNNIFNFFNATLASSGINVLNNNNAWTITGNKIYQTTTKIYTSPQTHRGISVASGNGHTVNNNIIGYSSAASTGTYVMGGTTASRFVGIDLTVGTLTASSVQGNTVSAITLSTSSGAATGAGILCGINILGGNVNVGTVNGNIIGATTGANIINTFPTTTGGMIVGINSSSTGTITIQNNQMGGLSSTGTVNTVGGGISGITISGASSLLTITNNTIGNLTANNLRAGTLGLTTVNSLFYGVFISGIPVGVANISNNIIQNGASYGTGTGGVLRGIYTSALSGSTTFSVTNNTVTNLTTNNGNVTQANGQLGNVGIAITAGVSNVISGNTISNLSNTNILTTAVNIGGISLAVASNVQVSNNVIYGISNTGVSTSTIAPSQVYGVFIRGGVGTFTLNNNMISLGTGQSDNTAYSGVVLYGGGGAIGLRMLYNTINIAGNVTAGAQNSFCFYRGGYSAFAATWSVELRNNLFTNSRTGGTGFHMAIANNFAGTSNTTGWGPNASNNNILNASNAAAVAWFNGPVTFAGWQAAMACDGLSYSGASVTYLNPASDLHINMGLTPNLIESGGAVIAGFNTDIDGQVRPGPIPSVNGGGIAPDIGADEFDGVILDIMPAVISHTALGGTCSTGDRTLTATITDATGVPITGPLMPRVYFRKNANAYFSTAGVLASGSATNGVWNFTINAAAMGGLNLLDQVSYFIIAQDVVAVPNIGSSPALGLVATDVNNVTTPPTTPYSYSVAALSGTYNVGAAQTYTTLTDAVIAYNTSCLAGPVTFSLTDLLYSPNETFPIVFLNNQNASATNSLLIIPAQGNSVVITPVSTTLTSIFKFLDARHIEMNGLNANLSSIDVINSNTTAVGHANFWLASSGSGCNNLAFKNMTAVGSNTNSSNGFIVGIDGAGPTATGGADNDNITIQGNTILRMFNAILALGSTSVSAGGMDNWSVTSNTFGPVSSGSNNLAGTGVAIVNALNLSVTSNLIQNISATGNSFGMNINAGITGFSISQNTLTNMNSSSTSLGVNSFGGIIVGTGVNTGSISSNYLSGIANNNTGGYGARGITIVTNYSLSNISIYNNMISDIRGYSDVTALYWPIGIAIEGTSGGVNVDFNSVHLFGSNIGDITATRSTAFYQNSTGGGINLRNNIFSNTYDNSTVTTDINYAYYAVTSATNLVNANYNNYYVGGTGNNPTLGFFGAPVNNLTAFQTASTQDLNSINFQPTFISNTDLHLDNTNTINAALNNSGLNLATITTDFDNQVRNTSGPDIGADEFTSVATCTAASGGTITPNALLSFCTTNTVILNSSTMSTGLGTSYNWQVSNVPGGPYTNIAAPTGTNLTYYSVLPNGTYFMVLQSTCANASLTAVSNEATVTIGSPTTVISPTNAVACNNSTITLTATGASSYSWSTNATTYSTSVTQTATTIYTVTGTSSCGTSTASINVVTSNPTVTAVSSSTAICIGQTATLTASGVDTYTWSSGPTNSVIPVTPTVTTNYTVTGTDANGCVANTTISVVTNTVPVVNVVGSATAVCAGQPINLTASGANTYTWNTSSNNASITVTPTTTTTYSVSGSNAAGCVSGASYTVNTNALPSVTAVTSASIMCLGSTATLTASGANTYTWNTSTTANSVIVSPSASTIYIVTGTDANGCVNSFTVTQTVSPCTGVDENGTNGLFTNVYPNPTTGMFSVDLTTIAEYVVVNSIGQQVLSGTFEAGKHQLNIQDKANGIYFVKIKIGNDLQSFKLIKE